MVQDFLEPKRSNTAGSKDFVREMLCEPRCLRGRKPGAMKDGSRYGPVALSISPHHTKPSKESTHAIVASCTTRMAIPMPKEVRCFLLPRKRRQEETPQFRCGFQLCSPITA